MKRKNRRKLLVDGSYQFGQAAVVITANLLVVLLAFALFSWLFLIAWDDTMAVNYNARIQLYLAVAILIVALFSVFFSLRRSRSVAGMMAVLHRLLENSAKGIIPERKIAFRKSDYIKFQELATPLNACLDQLWERRKSQHDLIERLEELSIGMERGATDNTTVQRTLASIATGLRDKR